MSGGQKAAEDTKGVFKGLGEASEDLRKNVNSYADNMLNNSSHGTSNTHQSTGIHPDAKKTGEETKKGLEGAGKKLEEKMGKR
ncbi:hypothetical protein KC332_g6495 [Hortaea werneckii]|uniref:Uncharacterized protein n=2 Tax=Hortaea werneckii TaxID=91943 RepID=A0A3M7H515_HORWE|nr:hypothetical protein KC358_g4574 [Hortaea werneckii]OTA31653.1 hypothetical protein BTJ68_08165 [Hortaea werneckii EXF-2000]KAI6846304.1 hypothetical protein KC350_g3989 [Hortaea werneckii]KAI6938712.1 hypothetical protein KC341_g4716 [Hortaea werneckii]KAI6940123.1 hypothetical protein KC348_g5104 [Hortaea werneckii]